MISVCGFEVKEKVVVFKPGEGQLEVSRPCQLPCNFKLLGSLSFDNPQIRPSVDMERFLTRSIRSVFTDVAVSKGPKGGARKARRCRERRRGFVQTRVPQIVTIHRIMRDETNLVNG